MSETARHKTLGQNTSLDAINALSVLDLGGLSYVQLRRLQEILQQACQDADAEIRRRAAENNSGDTVKVPSPKL